MLLLRNYVNHWKNCRLDKKLREIFFALGYENDIFKSYLESYANLKAIKNVAREDLTLRESLKKLHLQTGRSKMKISILRSNSENLNAEYCEMDNTLQIYRAHREGTLTPK